MTHYTQFREAYIRNGAKENNCTMAEYAECMDEQTCMDAWWEATVPFLRNGTMSVRWWNSVLKHPGTYAKVARWMKDNPSHSSAHDLDWAMAHVRRDARGALERAENAIEPDRSGCDANVY